MDKYIEQMQANGGLSEAAIEADYEAQQNFLYEDEEEYVMTDEDMKILKKADYANQILNKIRAAGINVEISAERIQEILTLRKNISKMTVDVREFEEKRKEIENIRNYIPIISDENKALVREQEFIDFQTSLIACKKFIDDLPGKKLPEIKFTAQNNRGEDVNIDLIVQKKDDHLVLATPSNTLIYDFDTKVVESNFIFEAFKDYNATNNCCDILVKAINDNLGKQLGEQRRKLKRLMQENAVLSGKALNELSEEETKELKENLKELDYEQVEGILVHKDKKIALTPEDYVKEVMNAKLLVDHNHMVYLLPENFAFRRINEKGKLESNSTPDTLTDNEFVELKTTEKKLGKRFGEAVEQANSVLIRIQDNISVYNARKRLQTIINKLQEENRKEIKDGKLFLYFEKKGEYVEAEIKRGKINILPALPSLADLTESRPTNSIISQAEELSSSIPKVNKMMARSGLYWNGKPYEYTMAQYALNSNLDMKWLNHFFGTTSSDIHQFTDQMLQPQVAQEMLQELLKTAESMDYTGDAVSHKSKIGKERLRTFEMFAEQIRNGNIGYYDRGAPLSTGAPNWTTVNGSKVIDEPEYMFNNGFVAGLAYDNNIILHPDYLSANAAVHEYTHLWDAYTQKTNPELWNKGLELFRNTNYWNEVISDPNYQDIKDDENLVLSEIHSRICGDIAEKVLNRIAELDGEQVKLDAIDWNKETWDYITTSLDMSGMKLDKENFAEGFKNLREFLSTPMKDLMESKNIMIKEEIEQKNIATAKELNRPAEPLKVYTFSPFGYEGTIVQVETDLRRGIPVYDIVGIADSAVKETRERIRAAFINSGLDFPTERVLQSLSPADFRKDSPMDLSMALGILGQTKQYPVNESVLALGELELSGRIRPVRGSVAAVNSAKTAGITNIVCDPTTAELLKDIDGIKILTAESLKEANEKLMDAENFQKTEPKLYKAETVQFNEEYKEVLENLSMDGHFETIRAIEIAVAGKHNILEVGEPGCGKTHLTKTLMPALTPKMTEEESQSITRINSLAGLDSPKRDKLVPPFRMPHQTATIEGICGGGPNCRPGEISLAHQGTLFMDETAEFRSSVIQMLRVPLESRQVTLSRAGRSTSYPADFQLAMAMNPCPCGNYGSTDKVCLCSSKSIENYWKKFSAPLLDRVEIKTFVKKNLNDTRKLSFEQMKTAITRAYEIQRKRGVYNSHLTPEEIQKYCTLDKKTKNWFEKQNLVQGEISSRTIANILKTSLTIANMVGRENIQIQDLKEAYGMCIGSQIVIPVNQTKYYEMSQEQIDQIHSNLEGLTAEQMIEKLEREMDFKPLIKEVQEDTTEHFEHLIDEIRIYHPEKYGFDKDDKIHIAVGFSNKDEDTLREDDFYEILQNSGIKFMSHEIDWNPVDADKWGNLDAYFESLGKSNIDSHISEPVYDEKKEAWVWKDESGNVIHSKYNDGIEDWSEYDAYGHEIHYKCTDGVEEWFEYDNSGNQIYRKDNKGYEKWKDSAGNVIHSKEPDGYEEWSEYDMQGHEVSYRNSEGFKVWHEYDEAGHKLSYRDSEGFVMRYDVNGNETYSKTASGIEHWYRYENGKRIEINSTNIDIYSIDCYNRDVLLKSIKSGKHPAFNLPSKNGTIETRVPTVYSYVSGKSYQGYNQLVMQALAVKLGYPKDRAGNAYVATEKQICSKDKENFVSEFKQKGKGITISLLLKDKESGKDYSTAITLYPIQAAKDWAAVNPKVAASPAKLPARTDNSYIVFDASSPDITPREWLANYLAAAKGNATFKTTREISEKVRNDLVSELEQNVVEGYISQFDRYFSEVMDEVADVFVKKIDEMRKKYTKGADKNISVSREEEGIGGMS